MPEYLTKEDVLSFWVEMNDAVGREDGGLAFKYLADRYAKSFSKLDVEQQGWVSEKISSYHRSGAVAELVQALGS